MKTIEGGVAEQAPTVKIKGVKVIEIAGSDESMGVTSGELDRCLS